MRTALNATGSLLALSLLAHSASAYQVNIKDTDELREVCSGMYGGEKAYISLTFDPSSSGQLALVLYEWDDVKYLGADTPGNEDDSMPKTYICTTSAVRSGLCTKDSLGSFITSLPDGIQLNQTSVYTTGIKFGSTQEDDVEEEQPVDEPMEEEPTSTHVAPTRTSHRVRPTHTAVADDSEKLDEIPTDSDEQEEAAEELLEEILDIGREHESDLEDIEQLEEEISEAQSEVDAGLFRRLAARAPQDDEEEIQQTEDELEDAIEDLKAEIDEQQNSEGGQDREEIQDAQDQVEDLQDEIDDLKDEIQDQSELADPSDVEEDEEAVDKLEKEIDELEEELQDQEDEQKGEDQDDDGEPAEAAPELPNTEDEDEDSSSDDQDEDDEKTPIISKPDQTFKSRPGVIPLYDGSIIYNVPKTGYYCVGVVPVTLVNSKKRSIERSDFLPRQEATHASYSGSVLFKNTFEGQLPAAEYPKIGFYLFLTVVYAILAGGWGFLCVKHYRELLPMQWYITGTIAFLVVEMLANQGYYRYINKHGGGASSLAFLFVVAVLNAGRNSISFFLLLIVSMGLSVVTPSLGSVMHRVRLLTAFHFVFGVLYAIGSVRVELETASLFLVLFLIFPLALSLTSFLMWTILSLNGTIMHLEARKQRNKLAIFKKLYRILMIAVVAVAVFFVISTLALSNRADEDYAPKNWRYRWILLDASLAMIYLGVFSAIAWLWRPSRDNVRFAMSQELAQDENDVDGEGYELAGGRPVQHGDDDFDEDEQDDLIAKGDGGYGQPHAGGIRLGDDRAGLKDENVVFALEDDDSDLEGDIGRSGNDANKSQSRDEYMDMDGEGYSGRKTSKYD